MKPITELWPEEKRAALRDELMKRGGWYSLWVHHAVPSLPLWTWFAAPTCGGPRANLWNHS